MDEASRNPITISTNIAYTLHFYAGTHKESLRAKASTALANGIALMVTEGGMSQASGDEGIYPEGCSSGATSWTRTASFGRIGRCPSGGRGRIAWSRLRRLQGCWRPSATRRATWFLRRGIGEHFVYTRKHGMEEDFSRS